MNARPLLLAAAFVFLAARPAQAAPAFELPDPGLKVVDYEKFGSFRRVGTADYRYEIGDAAGLAAAVGSGLYGGKPLDGHPPFERFKAGHPEIDPWKYVDGPSPEEDFYAWNLAQKIDEGTRLFYIAEALRRAGHVTQALKAYHALVVHFPRTYVWSRDKKFYWYAAPEAISRIRKLCATYPELEMELVGALVDVTRGKAGTAESDSVSTRPGRFVTAYLKKSDLGALKVIEERGGAAVKAGKYENGHWQLLKDGKPFRLKGVTYTSTTVGESAHALNLRPWMTLDDNSNGKNDGMFDSWIDANRNGRRDADEPVVGDAALLKEMGVNAIRYYHGQGPYGEYDPKEYNKDLMRTLARDYGIYFIMGDFLGAYTIGSHAEWQTGTDYTNPVHRERMLNMVKAMVLDHKDEPYVLFWLLGNENQHPFTHTNAGEFPAEYARFVNEAAMLIKSLDPAHPVGICNLNSTGVKEMAAYAPAVDLYGANVYSGEYSMGSTVQLVKAFYDRPLFFTEWGCDAYSETKKGEDEDAQARYIESNWADMELHRAGGTGEGNVIGGCYFEWMDEWWKSLRGDGWGDPDQHNREPDYYLPFPDEWAHEEWFGLMGQGSGSESPFLREKRKAYETLKKLWREP